MNTFFRGQRLRRSPALRAMVRETRLSPDSFIYPIFIQEGRGIRTPISAMPGQERITADLAADVARDCQEAGVGGVLLFGIPEHKDARGSEAWNDEGTVQEAARRIKDAVPDLCVVTDVCLCEYTSHGHCGLLTHEGRIDNDATLELLASTALSHARAGADVIAPSDMMDGRIAALRGALDASGFSHTPLMSYAAKYASAFYGPFREAAGSAPQFGDRKSYQMDPANGREALREVKADLEQGADIVMVKPALAYLDVIRQVRGLTDAPVAAYNVSGEYSMVKLAARQGLLDEKRTVLEILTGIRRAGADIIITYHALEAARWLS